MHRTAKALLGGLVLALCGTDPGRAETLWAGFGRAPLPVPTDGVLGGYGGLRDRRAQGLLDPPEARALALEQGGIRIALVALDLVIVRPSLRQTLLDDVSHLELDYLMLVATHTHSGPGGYMPGWVAELITSGSYQPGMHEALGRAAQEALQLAVEDLAPARVSSGTARLELAKNRRSKKGPHEAELPLLRFDLAAERAPILLLAYGAHPVVLSPRNHDYSADYVGAARAHLEARGWRPVFVPGPLGDQEPQSTQGDLWPRSVEKQRAQLEEIGARLAQTAHAAALDLEPAPEAPVLTVDERWIEPPRPRLRRFCTAWWLAPLLKGSLHDFLSARVPLQVLTIGAAELIALPAELTSALANELREKRAHADPLFVVSLANDWLGYVVDEERYDDGGYEACLSFYGAGFGAWLVEQAATSGVRP